MAASVAFPPSVLRRVPAASGAEARTGRPTASGREADPPGGLDAVAAPEPPADRAFGRAPSVEAPP